MAEKTNKPKPEEERPLDYELVKDTTAAAEPQPQSGPAAAVQPAMYKEHSYHTPEPSACPGSLTVQARNAAGQAVAGVTVRVTGTGFNEEKTTDDSGQVAWSLPAGSYNVTATAPAGFVATVQPSSIVIAADESKDVRVAITGVQSEIQFRLFHDVDGTGNPAGQPGVSGKLSFFTRSGKFLGCTTTNSDGMATHTFSQLDSVEIRLEDSYAGSSGLLKHRMAASLFAQLSPDDCLKFSIPLQTSGAELLLAATVRENGATAPLIGAGFRVYRGTDLSKAPVADGVFTGAGLRITGLEADMYTIAAQPPKTERGNRMRPVEPREGAMHLPLKSGVNDLRSFFVFEPHAETIVVRVVKDQFGSPLPGVFIEFLNQSGGSPTIIETDEDGIASFAAQRALYTVRPSTYKFAAEGSDWIIDSRATYQVDLRNSGAAPSPITIVASKEEHGVRCIVQDGNGNPRSFTGVEIYDEKGNKLKDAHTDRSGLLDERLPSAGHYTLIVLPQVHRVSFQTHSVEDLGIIRVAGNNISGESGGGGGGGIGRIVESFSELTAYPQLTDHGGGGGAAGRQRRPSGVSSASTSQYGYTIEGALREVLGWRPKNGDVRGFTEALTRSFERTEIDGRTEWSWTPRAAALVVESELGAITGAQKSIYERGKVAYDQAAPKLDAIYPLRQDADAENCDAVRYIVRTAFEDLVREFGQSGGPRVQLVNDKFNLLLGNSNLNVTEQLDTTCQVSIMRERFGLRRGAVNTIAEEENLTNFLIVVDHLKSLRITWNNNIQFFDRTGTDPFLGTQLVLLSRALGNVAEGVDELRYVLSSVLLDEAEQQTILIESAGQTPMYVSELLNWIEHVATVEGPQLLTESGKDGAGALRGTLELLRTLVTAAQNPTNTVPSAYRTTRVQRALQELALALQDASRLSNIQGVN